MKVLHSLSTPRAEGTPNLVLDWLTAGDFEQDVFVLHREPGDLTDSLRSGAHRYEEADFFTMGWRKFPGIIKHVRNLCHGQKPDLVICWTPGFANWVSLGARLGGARSILVHCGNPPTRGFREDWISRAVQWPVRVLGGRVICCSKFVRDGLAAVPLIPVKNLFVVPNGTHPERFAPIEGMMPEPFTAIMIANLESARDHETLLHAAVIVAAALPGFRLRLVGRGTKAEALGQLIKDLDLTDVVELTGPRRDIPDLLRRSSLFVFSTLEEGFGTVLIEALAAGLPVVSTDVPACREILDDGKFGRLVPCGDATAMADAILAELTSQPTAEEREARRAYASKFSIETMIYAYLQIS